MALLMREHSAAYSSFYLYLADSTPFQLLRSPTFSLPLSNEVSSYIYKVIRFFLSHYVFHSRIPWTPKWCFKNLHMLKFISVLWSSLGFDKCIISYIYHHRITEEFYHFRKSCSSPTEQHPFHPHLWQPQMMSFFNGVAFYRILYPWAQTACGPFRPASFTKQYVFRFISIFVTF